MLVIATRDQPELDHYLAGRIYEPLFLYEMQGLAVYKVYAKPEPIIDIPIPGNRKITDLIKINPM